jgi:hypothetical protein
VRMRHQGSMRITMGQVAMSLITTDRAVRARSISALYLPVLLLFYRVAVVIPSLLSFHASSWLGECTGRR